MPVHLNYADLRILAGRDAAGRTGALMVIAGEEDERNIRLSLH